MGVHNVAHYVVLYVLDYVQDEGRSELVRAARPPHSSLIYCSRRTDVGGRSKTGGEAPLRLRIGARSRRA